MPGADNFFLGNTGQFDEYEKARATLKGTDKPAIKPPMPWLLDQRSETKEADSFDFAKNQIQVFNLMGPMILISDPEVIQDMLLTKNAQINKPETFFGVMSNFLGKAFIFSKTDDVWKAKRKGIAHTFFKDKLIVMLDKLKDYSMEQQKKWLEEIRASKDGSTKIDMSKEVLHLFQKFLMHIVFGKNIDDVKVMIEVQENPAEPYKMQEMSISDANEQCWV